VRLTVDRYIEDDVDVVEEGFTGACVKGPSNRRV
jgi:hypothetical protein